MLFFSICQSLFTSYLMIPSPDKSMYMYISKLDIESFTIEFPTHIGSFLTPFE